MTSLTRSTTSTRAADIRKDWIVIDASGLILGRLASIIASRLRGKHKASFTPHMDDGDCIVVVNAEKVELTGRKRERKVYHYHTGYPGGVKTRSAKHILEGPFPERLIEKAVERMLPRGPLGRKQLSNLRVYKGSTHPHQAQQPRALDVASMNEKNAINRGARSRRPSGCRSPIVKATRMLQARNNTYRSGGIPRFCRIWTAVFCRVSSSTWSQGTSKLSSVG